MYEILNEWCCFCSDLYTKDRTRRTFVGHTEEATYKICMECEEYLTEINWKHRDTPTFKIGVVLPKELMAEFVEAFTNKRQND